MSTFSLARSNPNASRSCVFTLLLDYSTPVIMLARPLSGGRTCWDEYHSRQSEQSSSELNVDENTTVLEGAQTLSCATSSCTSFSLYMKRQPWRPWSKVSSGALARDLRDDAVYLGSSSSALSGTRVCSSTSIERAVVCEPRTVQSPAYLARRTPRFSDWPVGSNVRRGADD